MINRIVIISKHLHPLTHPLTHPKFSTTTPTSDPYYILGVDKTAQFPQIKKAFYKLASEYHPDKSPQTSQNTTKFLLIKQAYQSIKLQKGLTKSTGFIYDTDFKSMRPNPSRFDTDDQETRRSAADYTMYGEKVDAQGSEGEGAEYERFKGTFRTVRDINQVKIRVEQGEMRDAAGRFGLEKLRVKIQGFRDNSLTYLVIVLTGALSFFYLLQKSQTITQSHILQQSLSQQHAKQKSKRIFDAQQQKTQDLKTHLQKDRQFKQFINKVQTKLVGKSARGKRQQIQSGENCV